MVHWTKKAWGRTVLGLAVIIAAGVGLWTLMASSTPTVAARDSDTVTVIQGDANTVTVEAGGEQVSVDTSAAHVEDTLAELPGAADPPRSMPAPFLVAGTGTEGLVVRDGVTAENDRVTHDGVEAIWIEGSVVYVDCQVRDQWAPALGSTTWYKVRWPRVADQGDYWSNAEWLHPIGHNGAVPLCSP